VRGIAIEAARGNDLLKNLQGKLSALARISRAMELNIEQFHINVDTPEIFG